MLYLDMKTTKKENITFIPPIDSKQHGWLHIGGEILVITDIHHFDDFGVEQDTLTLDDGSEWITQDGGSTFQEN